MATSSNKRGQFWRADWFVGVLVVLAMLALHSATDFGIARSTDSSRTKTGLVLGSPSFMSPEPIAGKRVDGRSDLYPLGVMLFQMLADPVALSLSKKPETRYQDDDQFAANLRVVAIAELSAVSTGPAVPASAITTGPEGSEKPAVFTADDNPAFARTIAAAPCPILWPALMLQV